MLDFLAFLRGDDVFETEEAVAEESETPELLAAASVDSGSDRGGIDAVIERLELDLFDAVFDGPAADADESEELEDGGASLTPKAASISRTKESSS